MTLDKRSRAEKLKELAASPTLHPITRRTATEICEAATHPNCTWTWRQINEVCVWVELEANADPALWALVEINLLSITWLAEGGFVDPPITLNEAITRMKTWIVEKTNNA